MLDVQHGHSYAEDLEYGTIELF